ncbi:MAG: hypothetical protein ACTHJU_01080, partial [Sphingopyxis sp.]
PKPKAAADVDPRLNGEAPRALAMANTHRYPVNLLSEDFGLAARADTVAGLDVAAQLGARASLLTGINADAVMKSFNRLEQICRDMDMRCADDLNDSVQG